MISPAAQHRNRIAAQRKRRTGQSKAAVDRAILPNEAIVLKQFKSDLHKLASIRSRSRRNIAKESLLNGYSEWIDEFKQNVGYTHEQGSMFVWLLLWSIDVGHWQKAFDMSIYALNEGISSPDEFTRSLPETITEQITDGINKSGEHEQYQTLLNSLYTLVIDLDMTDQITAKLCKACGLSYLNSDKERAKRLLQKALELNSGSGVKRILQQLEKGIPVVDEKDYPLNTSDAAAILGVSVPTIIRHAKNHPDKLLSLNLLTGGRTVYRFKQSDVKCYKENYLVIKQ